MFRENNALRNQEFDGMLNSFLLLLFAKLQRHIDLVKIARVPHLTRGKDVEGGGKDHSGDGDNGPFLASPLGNALILDVVVRRVLRLHGRVSDLNKSGLEINPGSGDADGLLFTGGLVIARGQASPRA